MIKDSLARMQVAALYDIHGNLPALEATLGEVRAASVDLVVIGGDVFPGPLANEALALLLDLDLPVRFIAGNGDRETLALAADQEFDGVPDAYRAEMLWGARQINSEQRREMESWPKSVRVEISGLGDVLFCHATPGSDTQIFTRLTPENKLAAIFEDANAQLVVCGHTHMQFNRMIGSVRVVNAGSVGMPFGEPGAYWLLLGPGVQLRRTSYDLTAAAERIRAADWPRASDFAARNVLSCPSEEEALEMFGRAELG